MHQRGQYGTIVGSSLVHTLELKQRFNNAKTVAVQALLNELSADGTVSALGVNRWEVALRDGAWVVLTWYPEHTALEVTITDREVRSVDQMDVVRRKYEEILRRVLPRLRTYGATTVGSAFIDAQPYAWTPVGLTLYHSVGDRADAVKQMAIDWTALYVSLATQVGEIPTDPREQNFDRTPELRRVRDEELAAWKLVDTLPVAQRPAARSRARDVTERRGQLWFASFDPKKRTWWRSYAKPLFDQWQRFKVDQIGGDRTTADAYISFAERFQTNWDVYEGWKKKLDNLRADAAKRGFEVDTPKPADLPTTVWADAGSALESGASKVASGLGDVWNLAKYGVIGALGIGAVIALSSVASNLRSGKDPGEKYMELIRSRRPRAARAQRSLPPGEPEEA